MTAGCSTVEVMIWFPLCLCLNTYPLMSMLFDSVPPLRENNIQNREKKEGRIGRKRNLVKVIFDGPASGPHTNFAT